MKFFKINISLRYLLSITIFLILFSCVNEKKPESIDTTDLMVSEHLSDEALSLSWNILQKGQELANNGSTSNEIIKALPKGTIFQTNETSILFFVKESVPMLIEIKNQPTKTTTKGRSTVLIPQFIRQPALATYVLNNSSILESDEIADVIASQYGEGKRQNKKALILSPYLSDFGDDDDGILAKEYLEKSKNFKNGIDYFSNNTTLDHYKSFADYDLVHLSTHGQRFCNAQLLSKDSEIEIISGGDSNFCRTIIDTGIKHNLKTNEDAIDFIAANPEYKDLIIFKKETFTLKSAFFDHFYQQGIENKIWVFSACELGQRSDLVQTMKNIHKNGHFFYWLNTVGAEDALLAFEKFYQNLIKEGLDAKKGYDKIPSNLKENIPSTFDMANNDSIQTYTELLHIQTGKPRHAIEIIEIQHPEKKRILKEGDLYPIVGDFGDGNDEALTLDVKLIGYTQAEFEEKRMSLSLKVDDERVLNKTMFLPDQENDNIEVKTISGNEYGVQVIIKDIDIPDLGDKKEITLKAYIYFDDNKFSIHMEKVKIKAEGILAKLKDGNETIHFYYDDEKKAMRMEPNDSPDNLYFDDKGYMYFYNRDGDGSMMPSGWIKTNSMASMFMGQYSFKPIAGDQHINDNAGQFSFPIVAWAINYREKHFEQNSNFKKQKIDCGKPSKCTKFTGIVGEEAGHYSIFNPSGKLIKMGQGSFSVEYTYGEYNVQLPKAQEVSLPFNMN